MKLQEVGIDFHARGVQGKNNYKVAQTAKVMDMFSNMLYSDKIKAVIRELSTNAWDAHVKSYNTPKLRKQNPGDFLGDASTPNVPSMHLPSENDAEFRLRDYGTGLSPEDLENMYLTYGESNKNDSNDFNGCMGIGSKSPFAYTRSFTTTSYHNGMKYVYVNAKDDTNMPTLQKLHEEPTDEPNGLEIAFAVQRGDMGDFEIKAANVLAWFPVLFEVTGGSGYFRISKRDYSMEGDGWKIRKDTNISNAIMGYVEYPIEKDHFAKREDDTRPDDWYQHYNVTSKSSRECKHTSLLNLGLELEFDIGDVEMDISREGLQYTPATVRHIKDRLDKVLEEIGDQISDKFNKCTCLWDAKLLWSELSSGELRSVRDLLNLVDLKWNGQEIGETMIDVFATDFPKGVEIHEFIGGYSKPKRSDIVNHIKVHDKVRFYVNDLERGNYVACQREILDGKCRNIYLLKFDDNKVKQEFCDYIGIPQSHLHYCSRVPKPPKSAKKTNKENVFLFDRSSHSWNTRYNQRWWTKGSIDFKAGGLYLEINNWKTKKATESNCNRVGKEVKEVIDALEGLGITIPEIAGVKTCVVNKYEKSSKWQCFFAWAKQQVEDHVKKSNVGDYIADIQAHDSYLSREKGRFETVVEKSTVPLKKSDSPLKKLLDKVQELSKIKKDWEQKVEAAQSACSLVGLSITPTSTGTDLTQLLDEVADRYSVFQLVDHWDVHNTAKCTTVIELVNLVDSCEGK